MDGSMHNETESCAADAVYWRHFLLHSPDAVLVVNRDGVILCANPQTHSLLGFSSAELVGKTVEFLVPDTLRATHVGLRQQFVRQPIGRRLDEKRDFPCRCKDGSKREMEISLAPVYIGSDLQIITVLRDITDRQQARQRLQQSEARLREAQQMARMGSWELDLVNQQLHWSDEVFRLFEINPDSFTPSYEAFLQLVYPDDRQRVNDAYTASLASRTPYQIEHRLQMPDGRIKIVVEQGKSQYADNGSALRSVGTIQDITHLKEYEKQLARKITRDPLTGLPNREHFQRQMGEVLMRARERGNRLTLMFIDVDDFRNVNEVHGHRIGDRLLHEISRRLQHCLRDDDIIARMGGDEFAVLIHAPMLDDYDRGVAERLLLESAKPVVIDQMEFFVSCSIGITHYPADGTDCDTLLSNADAAMYHAKSEGKNNFSFYASEMNQLLRRRMSITSSLRRAISNGEFLLHYQPRVELQHGRIVGVEALIRWQDAERGLVSPAEFIPVAEESGLIVPIGEWVLHTACLQARQWQAQFQREISVAVNISARQFRTCDLVVLVQQVMQGTGLAPGLLELELTETMLMHDVQRVQQVLAGLRGLGVRLAVDDFGTGYSSLNYLKSFPLDALKIDRSFVTDLSQSAHDEAIVRAIIALAHSLDLRVVAEGVETPEQMRYLLKQGCDEVQGFYFSRPQSAAQISAMLQQQSRLQLESLRG
jgi:diguanylate cyclase (GGDEF)-like protein/PAS domain S-box-containing protein